MAAKKSWLKLLEPYFSVDAPTDEGEFKGFCPLHSDDNPSASFNLDKGVWTCFAGCGGGPLSDLVERLKRRADEGFVPEDQDSVTDLGRERAKRKGGPAEFVSDTAVNGWHQNLLANPKALSLLMEKRGLTITTIEAYKLGWDTANGAYTIPIYSADGELYNVRRYRMATDRRRSHYWSVTGMGSRRLYPESVLRDNDEVLLCEGELDALIANQNGIPAVTATGGAGNWKSEWAQFFVGKNVFVCYDADEVGVKGARIASHNISQQASRVMIVTLPFEVKKDHGDDLTDFFVRDGMKPDDLRELFDQAKEYSTTRKLPSTGETVPVSVLDSFNASMHGKTLEMVTTITGKRNPPYQIAKTVEFKCSMDAGQKCAICPMLAKNGEAEAEISPRDPIILDMIDSTKSQVKDIYRQVIGAPKCSRLTSEPSEYQNVEELFARPSVEGIEDDAEDEYTNRKLLSVGRHDTSVNKTFRVVGSVQPNPRSQRAEFLSWVVEPTESSIDAFTLDERSIRLMKTFQPKEGQAPLRKLALIAKDLSANVTKIIGRSELHMAMELVWHSVLNFRFAGTPVGKGWLEMLAVGDTRTGKSAIAETLIKHYQAGRMVSCEAASFAGIVGGLQQFGAGREWTITWGAIPLNDRRLVVLDEISGLSTEQISMMSSIRSSGIAQLTKIQTEQTTARTRLIWLGNPRKGKLGDYTFGIHAINPLIGNPEDVARFDFAMSVAADEVASEDINKSDRKPVRHVHTSEACHTLLQWVWSRRAEHVVWAAGSEEAVYDAAVELGSQYIEDPPLIQAANVRMKVARLAVALAARLFSTDETHECVVVEVEHVHGAVQFLNHLYRREGFGYYEASKEAIADKRRSIEAMDDMKKYLVEHHGMAKFLRSVPGGFRRNDVEDMLNLTREEAQSIINKLWLARMIKKSEGDIKIMPQLHQLLREITE